MQDENEYDDFITALHSKHVKISGLSLLLFPLPHTNPAELEAQKTLKMFPTELLLDPAGLGGAKHGPSWVLL